MCRRSLRLLSMGPLAERSWGIEPPMLPRPGAFPLWPNVLRLALLATPVALVQPAGDCHCWRLVTAAEQARRQRVRVFPAVPHAVGHADRVRRGDGDRISVAVEDAVAGSVVLCAATGAYPCFSPVYQAGCMGYAAGMGVKSAFS